ncbi:MarR family winged helix-turn-helix transcriptional regulator [Virgibacillus alimentarius]|uniref:DNA-binding MarR family transcriptional regulator n=1 Tax=Virgibacillus alimentarius TaxID=698769 RepID=A0ABS4S6N5_9BACI|nr:MULTISPECIES: MarR family transcriptional regulator [Virgibacillus]MBP2257172.1 DNA-binding MarR family transcriptional regulator [Virgibacillus alimentarius]HLR69400.1 MarR family transcriptional regulator [Virgibacillus sp.]
MDKDFFELEKVLRQIVKKIPNEWRKHSKLELSRTESLVLYKLNKDGKQRSSHLANALSVTTGGLTGITDKLVQEDFIFRERDRKDRRVVYLTISEKGKDALKMMYAARKSFIESLFHGLTLEELDQLSTITNKIVANLESETE